MKYALDLKFEVAVKESTKTFELMKRKIHFNTLQACLETACMWLERLGNIKSRVVELKLNLLMGS